jgi:hypothetical protein
MFEHKRRYDFYLILRIATYLVRLPPLLDREEEVPAERDAPVDIPPEERMVLEEDERTVLLEERMVLLDEGRTALLDDRDGDDVEDERTTDDDERDGVAVTLLRVGCVRVVVVTEVLREGATPRSPALCTRVPPTAEVRVAVVVDPLRTAVPRVGVIVRTLELP